MLRPGRVRLLSWSGLALVAAVVLAGGGLAAGIPSDLGWPFFAKERPQPYHISVGNPEAPPSVEDELRDVKGARRGEAGPGAPLEREALPRTFRWSYAGTGFILDVHLDRGLYEAYHARARSFNVGGYAQYATDPRDDATLAALARDLLHAARATGFPDAAVPDFLLAFVQSLAYAPDNATSAYDDYPRYPVETLVEARGDCEDTSILYAALLDALGYRAALLLYPGHMVAGVDVPVASGEVVVAGDARYAYAETSASGWRLGEAPERFRGVQPRVLPVRDAAIPEFSWTYRDDPETGALHVQVVLYNNGTIAATGLKLWLALETSGGEVWNQETLSGLSVSPGDAVVRVVALELTAPAGTQVRLRAVLVGDGMLPYGRVTEPFAP